MGVGGGVMKLLKLVRLELNSRTFSLYRVGLKNLPVVRGLVIVAILKKVGVITP